jgi:ferritin
MQLTPEWDTVSFLEWSVDEQGKDNELHSKELKFLFLAK